MTRRPRIGLTASRRVLDTVAGPMPVHAVPRYYVDAVHVAGGAALVLPASDIALSEVIDVLDGLLVTGGEDVEPSRYGQQAHEKTQKPDPLRDAFEIELIHEADARGLPAFCVCRGIQVLNVARGGTLIQDIPDLVEGGPQHARPDAYFEHVHQVRIAAASRLSSIFGGLNNLEVNTSHHQAVDRVGSGLRPVAWAPEGFIEAVEDENASRFLLGVQWHPEALYATHPEHLALFRALVEAARPGT